MAAYAEVLRRSGHPVRRLRTRIADEAPRRDETLFVLEPDVMEPEEARAIGDWVRSGGQLVVGGLGRVGRGHDRGAAGVGAERSGAAAAAHARPG